MGVLVGRTFDLIAADNGDAGELGRQPARLDILLGPVSYRDVHYAEEQVFGREPIVGGYRKTRFSAPRRVGTPTSLVTWFTTLGARTRWTLAETGRNMTDPGYRRASRG